MNIFAVAVYLQSSDGGPAGKHPRLLGALPTCQSPSSAVSKKCRVTVNIWFCCASIMFHRRKQKPVPHFEEVTLLKVHVNHLWILQVSSSQISVLDQFQKLINMVHAFPLCLSDIRCSPVRPNPSDMEHLWRRAPSTKFGPSTFRVSSNATSELPEIAGFWTRTESRCVVWLLVFHNSMVGSSFQLVQYGSITTGWWFQPLWKIWTSVGMIIPNIWENKKCSKPPTRQCC